MPSVSRLEDHAGYWLRFVSNHVSRAFARRLETQGATVAEWVLLRSMFDSGAANPSHIADRLGMARGTISKLIERLRKKQLAVRRTSDGDVRYQTVELTAAGKRLVPVLARLAEENDREFFGHLPLEEQSRLVSLLHDIVRRYGLKGVPC